MCIERGGFVKRGRVGGGEQVEECGGDGVLHLGLQVPLVSHTEVQVPMRPKGWAQKSSGLIAMVSTTSSSPPPLFFPFFSIVSIILSSLSIRL